jgi:hypothetical protein
MAYFAELNSDNEVVSVHSVDNRDCCVCGEEQEAMGAMHLERTFGTENSFKQCSFNERIRANFPSIGYTYREDLDMFIPPKPYPSWALNVKTGQWYCPVPIPPSVASDVELGVETVYYWDEDQQSWLC